jgi:phosphate transport system permease protein
MNSLVILDEKGGFYLQKRRKQLNLFTGTMATDVESFQLPAVDNVHKVSKLVLHDSGRMVFVIKFHTSELFRYLTDDPENPYLIETVKLLPESVAVTSAEFLLGQGSLLIAGSDGSLRSFFLVARDTSANQDGLEFREAKAFDDQLEPIVLMGSSLRDKTFAAASKDGRLTLFHGTSEKTLLDIPSSNPISALNISPRLNGLVTVHQNGQARLIEFDAAHPQTNLKTLFGKIWYEGYQEPSYTWQSSAGTDDFEPKLSLIPLIFGTLKATFYTLIFAIPIGILAAIYTSEFISLRTRSVVKPMMEMMASLPSVVLGFVAALVLAPIVETWISAVLVVFLALPLGLLLAAYLWQLVPSEHTSKVNDSGKLMFKASVVLFTMWISYLMGVPLEQLMFEGDFKSWLMGQQGSSTPFLFLMMLPIHFIIIFALFSRFWGRQINQRMMTLSAPKAALLDFARFAGLSIVSFVLSWLSAVVLQSFGVDVRGGFVDTYVQRNTLVVGLAMGFAVIPIIYTLAEDALKAVPEHLRAGSLGCGATHWQTAIWIVLPTAISGVFSAIMIGMGRAVGETMIVVMATGNTPIMETNIFNGLRALSATIAVELPEAVKEGTLYRVLFLAGLVLFSMTFFINTLAEIVRMRFRKRAKQL